MFEEEKEEYLAKIPDLIETAGQRQYLKYVLSVGFLGNILMWLAVLFLPSTVFYFFDKLFSLKTELV
ncbi:MAG TPA: hypothetical protein VNI84_09915 [Pyrinomonadaceae bacterium]|nr:hypothetical protein [Pyrinomonadaceae bacterium]